MRILIVPLAAIAAILAPRTAGAWSADGHRFVCAVASYEMNETARGRAKALLAVATREAFAESCAAPGADEDDEGTLHVPREARAVDMARDCARGCVLADIARHLGTLRGAGPRAGQADALRRLMRAVADVHHPLNLGFAADRGGRDIAATFNGAPTTLRAIWDEGLLRAHPDPWRTLADGYAARFSYVERRTWPGADLLGAGPLAWANESLYLMRTPATGYLGNPGGLDFGGLYVRQNQLVVLRRLSQAGVRLGRMLNALWPA